MIEDGASPPREDEPLSLEDYGRQLLAIIEKFRTEVDAWLDSQSKVE